jgi:hypothetical protein
MVSVVRHASLTCRKTWSIIEFARQEQEREQEQEQEQEQEKEQE